MAWHRDRRVNWLPVWGALLIASSFASLAFAMAGMVGQMIVAQGVLVIGAACFWETNERQKRRFRESLKIGG